MMLHGWLLKAAITIPCTFTAGGCGEQWLHAFHLSKECARQLHTVWYRSVVQTLASAAVCWPLASV
jgi:hypothetical protein